MTRASDLVEQGRYKEVWQEFCGFLDLTLPEFMAIQERLLLEQLGRIGGSALGQALLHGKTLASTAAFCEQVPLTTYDDYAPWLADRREDGLAEKPVTWAHTSGRSGGYKWAPVMRDQFEKMGEATLTLFLLASARQRGEVRLRKGDTLVYNTPPPPYMSGIMMHSFANWFDLRLTPPFEMGEGLDFGERVKLSFQMALKDGMDLTASISSVMMRIADQFAEGGRSMSFSRELLHPAIIARVLRGIVRSKLEHRPMLPRDLWRLKGAVCGGTDTAIYRDRLIEYWGVEVHEAYASTEGGVLATQAWDRRGLYLFPDVAFYEFIPEEEWERGRQDQGYTPHTVLIDQVRPGCVYELVITNFHGGPFLRYRTHDLIAFAGDDKREASIPAPSFFFKSRSADIIDLAGFTGIIDERSMWEALIATGIPLEEWSVRKEVEDDRPVLHAYVEFRQPAQASDIHRRLDEALRADNPFYADIHKMLGYDPLCLTVLPCGTFARYQQLQQAAGADLAHLKPPHLNASDHVIQQLLDLANA